MQRVFSSTTLLGANGVLTSAAFSNAAFSVAQPLPMAFGGSLPGGLPSLTASVFTDQTGTLAFQQSDNPANTNFWETVATYGISASTLLSVVPVSLTKLFWRLVYTNGATPQTAFELDVNVMTGAAESGNANSSAQYYNAVRAGNTFFVTNSAAQALSLNSTTATGIILYNPATSGVNLAILEVQVQMQSLPAGASATILTGGAQTTTVTQGTTNVANGILNAYVGAGGTSKATVGSAATIQTTIIRRIIPVGTAATVAASTGFPQFAKDAVNGALVIPPGNVISLQGLTTAATVIGQITWQEIAL